jgi:hypothetical protein
MWNFFIKEDEMGILLRKILTIVFISGCGLGNLYAAIPAHTGNECSDIHVPAFVALAGQINLAIASAQIDVSDHGETGAYSSASNSNLNYLNGALEKTNTIVSFLNLNNPDFTTYSEAGHVEGKIREVLHNLKYASYWASISAVYHDGGLGLAGSDAYQSFEFASQAMDTALVLRVKARRCYMDAYLY